MAFPKIAEVRSLSDEEIAAEIITVKKKLFELRLQKVTRQTETTHEPKHARHRLAQLLTVERERQLQASTNDSPVAEEQEE
ncbi:MAG: 50S ribosomal protein L29 [Spirulinaceae cyanobacterium]